MELAGRGWHEVTSPTLSLFGHVRPQAGARPEVTASAISASSIFVPTLPSQRRRRLSDGSFKLPRLAVGDPEG